jgi:hypothetical protein
MVLGSAEIGMHAHDPAERFRAFDLGTIKAFSQPLSHSLSQIVAKAAKTSSGDKHGESEESLDFTGFFHNPAIFSKLRKWPILDLQSALFGHFGTSPALKLGGCKPIQA